MSKFILLFESQDYDALNNRSSSVFEMIDFYDPTRLSPGIGMYQTKRSYSNVKLLELLENNLRANFKIGESTIISV